MKKYCLDTSGLSNPLENMPEDIHVSLWQRICDCIASGKIAVTQEIYGELVLLPGGVGACIKAHRKELVLEIGGEGWNWRSYIEHANRMKNEHQAFISEYNENRKSTVGLNDLSIIALAKTLDLPLVNMEKPIHIQPNTNKRKIPDVCAFELVKPMTFSEFLRTEGIKP